MQSAIFHVSGDAPTERLDQLIAIVSARIENGEPVDLRALTADCPERCEQLEMLLPTLQALADIDQRQLSTSTASAFNKSSSRGPLPVGATSTDGVLGDFRISREIGRGGMGVVYEAEQISLSRRVALKVLPFAAMLDKQQLARFKNEARAAATLDHPNIVAIYSVGNDRGVHYYAMQLIEGRSLAEVLAELKSDRPTSTGQMIKSTDVVNAAPPADTVKAAQTKRDGKGDGAFSAVPSVVSREYFRAIARLGIEAGNALDHAHRNGILHRDIKPANLLVDDAGKLWVTDFGLARIEQDAGMTNTGDILGTLRYMSPEQALANRVIVDHRSDVYSLGSTIFELLSLQPAYGAKTRSELLQQISIEEPRALRQLNRQIPTDLETIVGKAMERNPTDRYATAEAFANDLNRFLQDQPIHARPTTPLQRLGKWSRRHRGLMLSAFVILCIATVSLAVSTILVTGAYREAAVQKQQADASLATTHAAINQMLTSVADAEVTRLPEFESIRDELLDTGVHVYTKLIEHNPNDSLSYMRRAHLHESRYRYEEARRDLESAAAINPKTDIVEAAYAHFLARCQKTTVRDYKAAVAHAQTAVDLDPKKSANWEVLALALRQSKRLPEALVAANKAVEVDNKLARAFATRAEVYRELRMRELALADINRAIELDPSFGDAYRIRAGTKLSLGYIKHDKEMMAEAIKDFERAVECDRFNTYIFEERGDFYFNSGDFRKALADFDTAIKVAPSRSFTYKHRAATHFKLQNYAAALQDITKAVELEPLDISNLLWIPPSELASCRDEALQTGMLHLADETIRKTQHSREHLIDAYRASQHLCCPKKPRRRGCRP